MRLMSAGTLILLAALWAPQALAQDCSFMGVTLQLTTQAQVDDFQTDYGPCNRLLTGLLIDGGGFNNITNLDGLQGLVTIDGSLNIERNASLGSLTGLEDLTTVGGALIINRLDILTSLTGLSSLGSVGSVLRIERNALLADVDALGNLTSVGGEVGFSRNPVLENVSGLSGLTTVPGTLSFFDNDSLTSLQGLSGVTTVEGNLNIQVSEFTSLGGLDALGTIGGSLFLFNNAALESVNGLEQLSSIGSFLSVTGNTALTDCAALAPVLGYPTIPYDSTADSVGEDVEIDDSNGLGAQSPDDCLLAFDAADTVNIFLEEGIAVTDGVSLDALAPTVDLAIIEGIAVSDQASGMAGPLSVSLRVEEGIAVSDTTGERDPDTILTGPGNQPPIAGVQFTVEGLGFMPFTPVQLFIESTPVLLGEADADQFGRVRISTRIPDFFTPGRHTLVLVGQGMDGAPRTLRKPVTVTQDLRIILLDDFEPAPDAN